MSAAGGEMVVAEPVAEVGSLSHRIAQRRKERERKRGSTVTLPIPGYRDLFAATYRRLTGPEIEQIADRAANGGDVQAAALDTLINACVDLKAVTGHEDGQPVFESLESRWTTQTVSDLFETDFSANTTVRAAMREVLDYAEITQHFAAYTQWVHSLDEENSEDLPGESRLSGES